MQRLLSHRLRIQQKLQKASKNTLQDKKEHPEPSTEVRDFLLLTTLKPYRHAPF